MNQPPSTDGAPGAAPWWATFYDDRFAALILDGRPPEVVEATADFLMGALALGAGDRVFDQGCGVGHLSLALASRGLCAVGVDLIPGYIAAARARAEAAGLEATFEAADAFTWRPALPCAGAFNWNTSFGYAEDDADNVAMLRRAWEALRPGGRFALDHHNLAALLRGFRPDMTRTFETPSGAVTLTRESRVDLPTGMLRQRWTFRDAQGTSQRQGDVRLFAPRTLRTMMEAAGFEAIDFYGDLQGGALELDSPRCVVVGRRPDSQ